MGSEMIVKDLIPQSFLLKGLLRIRLIRSEHKRTESCIAQVEVIAQFQLFIEYVVPRDKFLMILY